jgi:hypothetical protein
VKVTVRLGPRFWDTVVTSVTLAEIYAIRSKDPTSPWSHWFRVRLHLDTPQGRRNFGLGWTVFSVWLWRHLCNQTDSPSSVTLEL